MACSQSIISKIKIKISNYRYHTIWYELLSTISRNQQIYNEGQASRQNVAYEQAHLEMIVHPPCSD